MMFLSACVVTTCLRAWAQQPACVVGGTVTDSSSKQPVVRARVIAEVTGAYSLVQLTDRQGNFCFPHLSPATYHVLVQKAGYMEAQHGAALAVEEGSAMKPLALAMTPYARLSGVALDAVGAPWPAA